jgi:hypothetical protein
MIHRSKHADKGKETEALVREWLEERSSQVLRFAMQRLPDSRAARNPLPPQPADFYFSEGPTVAGTGVFSGYIEAKETTEESRLPKAKIRQFGLLHKFYLAGQRVFVIVKRTAHSDWTYFTGAELFDFPEGTYPKSFAFKGRPTFPTHKELLTEIFQ